MHPGQAQLRMLRFAHSVERAAFQMNSPDEARRVCEGLAKFDDELAECRRLCRGFNDFRTMRKLELHVRLCRRSIDGRLDAWEKARGPCGHRPSPSPSPSPDAAQSVDPAPERSPSPSPSPSRPFRAWLSIREACTRAGLGEPELREVIASEKIRTLRGRGGLLVCAPELQAWLDEFERERVIEGGHRDLADRSFGGVGSWTYTRNPRKLWEEMPT